MAIYRTGTASMTSNGIVTGDGTKWQDSLSLIRVGSTVVFMTNPVQMATISAIVSDTEIRVTNNDGGSVPAGTKYVILLSDSITVDGLAQDVAETLKYYQGKETAVQQAIDALDMTKYTQKSNNLSDLSSPSTARLNLSIDRLVQGGTYTTIGKPSSYRIRVDDSGDWGVINGSGAYKALPVSSGGTGKSNSSDAWKALLDGRTAAVARTDLGLGDMATQNSSSVNITGGSASLSGLSLAGNLSVTGVINDAFALNLATGATEPLVLRTLQTTGNGYIRFRDHADNPIGFLGYASGFTRDFQIASNVTASSLRLLASGAVSVIASGSTYSFQSNGSAVAPGAWVNNSDVRIKYNIKKITNPLEKMRKISGYTWSRRDGYMNGIGFIAQEVGDVFPDHVFDGGGDRVLEDGSVVENLLSVDTQGVSAALHHEAILALMDKIDELNKKIEDLESE